MKKAVKAVVVVSVLFSFLFFEQFLKLPPDTAMLFPGMSSEEISAHIDSLVYAHYENVSTRVDLLLNRVISKNAPGAAVAVIQNGRFLHKNGYGLADLRTKMPIQPETCFMLASVSKQFTAMAIMILKEEGKIAYEDTLPKYFPEVPHGWKNITIKNLLTHTSGIPDRFYLIGYAEGYSNQDILERLIKTRYLDFMPGRKYKYSNSGYNLLAMIVEKVSGQPFREFLKERIFDPLGMYDTVVYDKTEPLIENRAIGYRRSGRGYRPNDFLLWTTGSSGIFSNVEDLFKWDQSLYTEKLVSAETLKEAFSPHAQVDSRESYGYGWRITANEGINAIYHSGSLGGAHTIIFRIPEKHFTIILLANAEMSSRKRLIRSIAELYHPGLIETLWF